MGLKPRRPGLQNNYFLYLLGEEKKGREKLAEGRAVEVSTPVGTCRHQLQSSAYSVEPDLSLWQQVLKGKSIRNQYLFCLLFYHRLGQVDWARHDRDSWLCNDEFFMLISQQRLAKYSGFVATTFYFMYIPDILQYVPLYKDSCSSYNKITLSCCPISFLVSDFLPDF